MDGPALMSRVSGSEGFLFVTHALVRTLTHSLGLLYSTASWALLRWPMISPSFPAEVSGLLKAGSELVLSPILLNLFWEGFMV